MVEFIEVFKNETEYLHTMITATQEKFVPAPGRHGTIYVDTCIVAHSNEAEWQKFKADHTNEAILDRIVVVKVPYNLRLSEEVKIYKKFLARSKFDACIAPHTLQLLHGEQAALQLCGQLTNVCDKMDEKWYAASQVIDEARHIEAFAKFMQRKMGTIYPIGGTLKVLLDLLLEADTAQKKTLGLQTLFEGMAVGIMDMLRTECRNPLLIETLRRVEQDEARHAAFGVLMMRRVVREASTEEKNEMEDWAFSILEALNANQQLDMLHQLGPKYDLDPEGITRAMLGMEQWSTLNSMPYMHTVVPNLRNLGLITERTEGAWRKAGMMVDSAPGVKGVPVAAA
jgi:hypothetical protein